MRSKAQTANGATLLTPAWIGRAAPGGAVLAALLLGLLGPTAAMAATIHANPQLGLQYAIDRAAPGDTIMVNPGRYQQYTQRQPPDWTPVNTIGFVDKFPLTLIGVDIANIRIGPQEFTGYIDGVQTLGLVAFGAGSDGLIRVENLHFENSRWNVQVEEATLEMKGCLLRGSIDAASLALAGTLDSSVENCQVVDNRIGIWAQAGGEGNRNLVVRSSNFERNATFGGDIGGAINTKIESCSFSVSGIGIQLAFGGTGELINNHFSSMSAYGISVENATVEIYGNHVEAGGKGSLFVAFSGGLVTGTGNYLGGGTVATVYVASGSAAAHLTDGVILNGGGSSVIGTSQLETGFQELDFRRNWWGTTDSTQISEWIIDQADYGHLLPVVFDPFLLQEPVATEKQSMGSLKALFRRP